MDDNRIYTIAVIPGDGIGPEITRETVLTLKRAGEVFGQSFRFEEVTAGTQALRQGRCPMPPESLTACRQADGILMGKLAVGSARTWTLKTGRRAFLDCCAQSFPCEAIYVPAFFGCTSGAVSLKRGNPQKRNGYPDHTGYCGRDVYHGR